MKISKKQNKINKQYGKTNKAMTSVLQQNQNKKIETKNKMPGALEIDFTKVKRKIRSAPGSAKTSPKTSPTLNRRGWTGFGRPKKKKPLDISTPNLTKSKLESNTFLSSSRLNIALCSAFLSYFFLGSKKK